MKSETTPLPTLAIVFDFGGVLLDWNPRYLYRKVFSTDEQAMERFLAEISFTEWNRLQDAGRPYAEAVADLCARHPHYCDLIRLYDERYLDSISGAIPGTVEILHQLKEAGYPLYGLSNFPTEKYQLVRPLFDFFNWFQGIIISGEVGIAKPDPRIFQALLAQINHSAQDCLLIDDTAANIAAAQVLGFQTIHFQAPAQLAAELVRRGILA